MRAVAHKSRPRRRSKPTAREVGIFALKAFVCLFAFVVVLQVSIAGAFRSKNPEFALEWAPYDAAARAKLAAQLAGERDHEATQAAVALARDAIQRDALTPVALRALGMIAARNKGSQENAGLALMTQAERLSRRDEATQIWLIEYYSRRGQAADVVKHFDLAMRTSWSAQQTLFPLIASLIADDRVLQALVVRMREKPDWVKPFMSYLVENGSHPAQMIKLARRFLNPGEPEDLAAIKTLLRNLASKQEYELAWDFYAHLRSAGSAPLSRGLSNGDFEGSQMLPLAPFAWSFADEPDLWAGLAPAPSGGGNVLQLSANSGRGGEVARQLVRLAPGNYRLRAQVGDVPQDAFERPELRVHCADRTKEETLLSMKPQSAGPGSQWIEGVFTVPADCHFQWLAVAIAGEGPPDGSAPWIDNVQLADSQTKREN